MKNILIYYYKSEYIILVKPEFFKDVSEFNLIQPGDKI